MSPIKSPCAQDDPLATAAVAAPVVSILRLEGLAIGGISVALYAQTGASWWLFAALWLLPDLSMLGYLIDSCWGARLYNAAHTYVVPITLGIAALLLKEPRLLPYALVWVNHIAIDRLMGYGLKYPDGFGFTHLGKLGKKPG